MSSDQNLTLYHLTILQTIIYDIDFLKEINIISNSFK